ncbi:MAG: WYL domain-containing protein [Streptococcaceae bacterium]|jgi:predicted DNA-binding transcriptional regulator YafY|nr:WYL domain-containing protein [Streptococcaceae bacterium]
MKKAERLNLELIFLRNKHEFHLKDLVEKFDISRRTALRDVEDLLAMGLPAYSVTGPAGGYHLINQKLLTPVTFSQAEIQAIFFALHALELVSSTPFEQAYPQIQEKLLATLPISQQAAISQLLSSVHYVQRAPLQTNQPLSLILQSILEGQILSLTYSQHQISHLELQIYELFYRDGIWFCSAWDFVNESWGTFRCDYISDCRLAENQEHVKTMSELVALGTHHEANYHEIPFSCKLTAKGQERFKRHHYPFMRLENEQLLGGYNPKELDYLVDYLISFAGEMTIISPLELKSSYELKLKEMIKLNQSIKN